MLDYEEPMRDFPLEFKPNLNAEFRYRSNAPLNGLIEAPKSPNARVQDLNQITVILTLNSHSNTSDSS
jgi:hypothetical protein